MEPLAFWAMLDTSTFTAYPKKDCSHGAEKTGWDRLTRKMLSKLEKTLQRHPLTRALHKG